MNLARYSKTLTALFVGVGGWWQSIIGGPVHITSGEWNRLYFALGAAFGVYVVPNAVSAVTRAVKSGGKDAQHVEVTPVAWTEPMEWQSPAPIPSSTEGTSS
jgi:hypothetical protein